MKPTIAVNTTLGKLTPRRGYTRLNSFTENTLVPFSSRTRLYTNITLSRLVRKRSSAQRSTTENIGCRVLETGSFRVVCRPNHCARIRCAKHVQLLDGNRVFFFSSSSSTRTYVRALAFLASSCGNVSIGRDDGSRRAARRVPVKFPPESLTCVQISSGTRGVL